MPKEDEVKSTEYPKSLHIGGDRNAEHVIVNDEAEERAARAKGHKMIDPVHDKAAAERLGGEEVEEVEQVEEQSGKQGASTAKKPPAKTKVTTAKKKK